MGPGSAGPGLGPSILRSARRLSVRACPVEPSPDLIRLASCFAKGSDSTRSLSARARSANSEKPIAEVRSKNPRVLQSKKLLVKHTLFREEAGILKGVRPWHCTYLWGQNKYVKAKFLRALSNIQNTHNVQVKNLIKTANGLLKAGNPTGALKTWNTITFECDGLPQMEGFSSHHRPGICHPMINLLLDAYYSNDRQVFAQLCASLPHSLYPEMMPELIRAICLKGDYDNAAELLLTWCEAFKKDRHDYIRSGLTNSLNSFLYYTLIWGRKSSSAQLGNWEVALDTLSKFDHGISPEIIPSITQFLHKRIPTHTYLPLLKLLVSRGVDLKQHKYDAFLRAAFQCSQENRYAIIGMAQDAARATGQTSPIFNVNFYEFAFWELSTRKSRNLATWILKHVFLRSNSQSSSIVRTLATHPEQFISTVNWKVIFRAACNQSIVTATQVYDYMKENGIALSTPVLSVIFRGFRKRDQEQLCYDLLDMHFLRPGRPIPPELAIELLLLFKKLYSPSVVAQLYTKIVPLGKEDLIELGLYEHVQPSGDEFQPPIKLDPSLLRHTHLSEYYKSLALNAVYGSVLPHLEEDRIVQLYKTFKKWAAKNSRPKEGSIRPTPHVLVKVRLPNGRKIWTLRRARPEQSVYYSYLVPNALVNALLHKKTRESVNLAHKIFVDSMSSLKFSTSDRRQVRNFQALGNLSYWHCRPMATATGEVSPPQVQNAIHLVSLARKLSSRIPMVSAHLYIPIIKYYKYHEGNDVQAKRWLEYANRLGAKLNEVKLR